MHPMVLVRDEAQVKAQFSLFGDSANLDARLHGLRRMHHRLRNRFGRTQVMWDMSNLILVHLDIVLVSVQDRCIVCAKCSIGTEIILDAPDGTPR
jgi:hypothetical protein